MCIYRLNGVILPLITIWVQQQDDLKLQSKVVPNPTFVVYLIHFHDVLLNVPYNEAGPPNRSLYLSV